jgi:hypothetical protein
VAVQSDGSGAVTVAEHAAVHFRTEPSHLGALGVCGQALRGVIEGLDFLADGEVFVGDGAVGDPLWRSGVLELSEYLSGRCSWDRFAGWVGGLVASAVVGGVVGPVSAAGALPRDGDADVDAAGSRASRAAGSSVARWNSALERSRPGWSPSLRNRSVR